MTRFSCSEQVLSPRINRKRKTIIKTKKNERHHKKKKEKKQKKIMCRVYLNFIRYPILSTTHGNNETAYTAIKQHKHNVSFRCQQIALSCSGFSIQAWLKEEQGYTPLKTRTSMLDHSSQSSDMLSLWNIVAVLLDVFICVCWLYSIWWY